MRQAALFPAKAGLPRALEAGFARFWAAYPERKPNPRALAEKEFARAIKAGAAADALNEDLLTRELQRQRFGQVTRDDMRGLLSWLDRQGLVEIERLEGDLWAVTASRAGRDVARGAEHPGIAQPL
jgi:hypothetical protein